MSASGATIELTREELYERVWSTPRNELASEFGLSEDELARLCKRHKIPRPSGGYWAKRNRGKEVEQWPLMPVKDESLQVVRIHESETRTVARAKKLSAVDPEIAALIDAESAAENQIQALTDLRGAHPFVTAIREALSKSGIDEYGRVTPRHDFKGTCFDVGVSKQNVHRALLLLHSLVRAFKDRGYPLGEGERNSKEPNVEVLGRRFRVSVREASKQQKKTLTKQERAEKERYPWRFKDYVYVPSGVLELHLDRGCYCSTARICDTTKAPLEQRLNQFVVCMLKAVDRQRVAAEERRRAEVEAEILKQAAIDKEMVVRANDVRLERLRKAIPKWEDALRVKDYIHAVRAEAMRRFGTVDELSEIGRWLHWAEAHLNAVDPLADARELPTYSLTATELDQLKKECASDWCGWSQTFRPRQPR